VAADNRLTADQLAALAPGDPVVIESAADVGRPRRSAGTVVRIEGPHVVVSWRSARGVLYLHRYGRRDGLRIGGGHRAELVNAQVSISGAPEQRHRERRIDEAYRAWARSRGDVEKLRDLQAAISACLDDSAYLDDGVAEQH
jgi:hypothetical protein